MDLNMVNLVHTKKNNNKKIGTLLLHKHMLTNKHLLYLAVLVFARNRHEILHIQLSAAPATIHCRAQQWR